MPSSTRKQWSYTGVLPVRYPTAGYRTKPGRNTFDPSKWVYLHIITAEVPDIQRLMGWAFRPSAETCGDCIESLLAVAENPEYNSLKFVGISVHDGADFFREMSYKTWRVWRVVNWHNATRAGPKLLLTDVLKPAAHSTRCTACKLDVPHTVCMRCTVCRIWGCGLAIRMFSDGLLLCEQCRPNPNVQNAEFG